MEKQQIDRRLTIMARQSGPSIPKEYEQQLQQLLWTLSRGYRRRKVTYWKTVAAMLAVVLLLGSSSIQGAIHYLNDRMSGMTDTEISGYNELVQSVPLNVDRFSRAFSAEEKQRMLQLKEEYLEEGRYPLSELIIVDNVTELSDDTISYVADSSRYFLPERSLSDEELLELLDFGYKRSYSVAQANREIATDMAETEADADLKYKAAEAVHAALGMDVSQMYCRMEVFGNSNAYYLTYQENAVTKCCVVIEGKTGRVTSVARNLTKEERESVRFEEKELENGKLQLEKCLAHSTWGAITVQKIMAQYYLQEDGESVNRAEIYYLAELSDGSAYTCTYNVKEQRLDTLEYYEAGAKGIQAWYDPMTKWTENKDLSCIFAEMNNYGL